MKVRHRCPKRLGLPTERLDEIASLGDPSISPQAMSIASPVISPEASNERHLQVVTERGLRGQGARVITVR